MFIAQSGWMSSDSYEEDMTIKNSVCGNFFDIIKVWQRTNMNTRGRHCSPHSLDDCLTDGLELIWERVELPETDNEPDEESDTVDKITETDEFGSKEITFY